MGWENKVVWTEGMFLQPQHLQQQERYFDRLVRASTAGMRPFAWGLAQLDIDTDLLNTGKFALRSASGLMPDGTPFNLPSDVDPPRPIDVPEATRDAQVYLLLPVRLHGAVEAAPPEHLETVARFATAEHETRDSNAGYQTSAVLQVGRLRLRYALEGEARAGHTALPLARIVEMRSDGKVVLDDAFIPPVLVCQPSQVLAGFLSHLQGRLHQRAEALAGRLSEGSARGAGESADYMLLQVYNRAEPLVTHLAASMGQIHPEALYQAAIGLAGELATFTEARKRPVAFPPYRHEDLQATFRPVIDALDKALSAVLEQNVVRVPLRDQKRGIRAGRITDPSLVTNATWVLGVKAQMPGDALRRNLPNLVKIAPVEQIIELINSALPGIAVRALATAPRQLPYYAGTTYFELERNGPYWASLANSGGIAIHVTGDLPGLEMECWAIRG